MSETAAPRRSAIDRFLNIVETGGNALPHPATLFALLALLVVLMSGVAAWLDVSAAHPSTGEPITVVNLLTLEGLHRMSTSMVTNFTSFAPLGTVLVALLGIGVAEHSGLIGAALRLVVLASPRVLLTPVVVFAGVMSNMASEIGYVLMVPLAGLIFLAAGRHPILGMAAAFAGVSGGYSANLLIGTIDPLLAGLSQEAARIVDPAYTVTPVANWYFMIASTPLITLLGWYTTERIVAPRFAHKPELQAASDGETHSADPEAQKLKPEEKRGLWWSLVATAVITLILIWAALPKGLFFGAGFMRDPVTGDLLRSPMLNSVVAIIFLYGVVVGVTYGIVARTVRSDEDVIKGMGQSMSTLGVYLVLTFFAAQFVAFFNWTQLGLIFAVEGASLLDSARQLVLGGETDPSSWRWVLAKLLIMGGFIGLTAVANLFMGSASAKWALMAPIFVPMFMILGYSPELTQIAYRIGDSVTNIISPMMSYFALIIAFLQRYEPKAGIGTVISVMLPYSVVFAIGWSILFAVWLVLGLPIGPGSPLEYIQATPAG